MPPQQRHAPVPGRMRRPSALGSTFGSGPWDSTICAQASARGYLRVSAERSGLVACKPFGGREAKVGFGLWREQCQTE
jgi:hypothetical protein